MIKLSFLAALAALAGPGAALAAEPPKPPEAPPRPEVIERDAQGRATKVRLDGQVVAVCTPERTDGCVNPREVGLDQGGRAINYWPGRPASEIAKPLPVDPPKKPD
ncbi:MAG: hypothetical protein ACREBO_08470 [Novosphingobium sp.]